ncbi:hypothetical protein [Anaerobacillus arseniciselenatis]|uniref:hypothetical protein n=1 Tax=Anaerobacillus arseniciselenatis TaxID=85682 RepID=UPI001FE03520|nr:hypothetical protein [Anaerobacillus arseniciselenatis]
MELMTSWEKKGFEKGIEEGIGKGFERGIEKGIEKGLIKVAKQMLAEGYTIKEICKLTGITEEDIIKMKEELEK